jgi:hypothetical protein
MLRGQEETPMKLTLGLCASLGAAGLLLPTFGCGSDAKPPLFEPKPECEGEAVVPFAGDAQNVISALTIATLEEGFDLDGDGEPDNKLAAVGALAREPIEEAIADYEVLIPFEYFDLADGAGADECVKFAIYLGVYKHDADTDGQDTAVDGGDCDDTRMTSAPGLPEIADNFVDDDCDGLADENDTVPSADTADHDGDGVTLADGDCDDSVETGAMVMPGMDEICGDGLDNDCDGTADRGPATAEACDPYDGTPDTLDLDPLSFDDNGDPVIVFDNGEIDAAGGLVAGPSIFSVSVPVIDGVTLDLRITGAQIIANVEFVDGSVRLTGGRLGGILDARTMDNIRGLEVEDIGLVPENSLLDATFANVLGTLLALNSSDQTGYEGCKTPDIDVDRDGLEAYCDSNTSDDIKTVDTCIDGDGTVIMDEPGVECTEALLPDGKPRFPDGISVALTFETQPTILRE